MGQIVTKCFMVLILAGCSLSAGAVQLRLQGEQAWLQADNEPLYDVLAEFARLGVKVRMDPGVHARITRDEQDRDVEILLKSVLSEYGYVLIWSSLETPGGPMVQLDEIQVYRPGRKQEMKPLERDHRKFVVGGKDGIPEYIKDEIVVGFRDGIDQAAFKQFLARIGGTVVGGIPALGIYRIRVPPGTSIPALIKRLQNDSSLALVEPNYVFRMPSNGGSSSTSVAVGTPGPAPKGAPSVAVLDSGFMLNTGLDQALQGSFDALNPDQPITDPVGHGTQMAYIASGTVNPDGGSLAASTIPILAVRTFDEAGLSTSFDLMESLNYAVSQGAKVVNMSWGSSTSSQFVSDAVQWAHGQGVVLVASAGNEATGQPVYPAAYNNVVAVAALADGSDIWENSNYGDFVDLAAPGQAALPVGYEGPPGNYAGTSIASAYTSRALAQYFTAYPDASAEQAVKALENALTDVGSAGKDPVYGNGVLDEAAMQRMLENPP